MYKAQRHTYSHTINADSVLSVYCNTKHNCDIVYSISLSLHMCFVLLHSIRIGWLRMNTDTCIQIKCVREKYTERACLAHPQHTTAILNTNTARVDVHNREIIRDLRESICICISNEYYGEGSSRVTTMQKKNSLLIFVH